MKRTEVRVIGNMGCSFWAPAKIVGEEEGMLIVEYTDLYGKVHEGMFYSHCLREVDAEITDVLLQEAANAAIREIKQHTIMIDDELLEAAGKDVLHALRLRFGFPS